MKFTGTAFLLVLLSITTNAARTTKYANPCATECSNKIDPLFKAGQTYTYSYEGRSNITTIKGSYESTGISIVSKVSITGLSNCEMKLSMTGVQVFDKTNKNGDLFQISPNSQKIKQILEQNDVFFTRENGLLKSICMDKDEPIWSENVKKVILDSLANQNQKSEKYFTKKTNHGKCYIENQEPDKKDFPKSMMYSYNLKFCENPNMPNSIFTDVTHATMFQLSKVDCVNFYQRETELTTVDCKEEYIMKPFKQNGNQIRIAIQTTLLRENQVKAIDQSFSKKNMLKTEIEQSQEDFTQDEATYTSVKEILKEVCTQQSKSESAKIPKLFMQLINQLKELNAKEFKEIYLDVQKTDICDGPQTDIRTIFYDAVGFINTPAATSVMVDLIKSKLVSAFDQNIWLTSLSFMQQTPTLEMLKSLESLISTDTPSTPMYLGISAVTHLYCKNNFQICLTDPTIKSIVSKFLKNLNNDCSITKSDNKDQSSNIQISLKALGNLKIFSDEVTTVLQKCISTKTNPLSIRISALEVMKHMDCRKDRKVAMDILLNNENDSELRINAYLTVMGCPDVNTLFKVREILANEKVNQVGSFIWTHLTNIKESSDVLKFNIQLLLDDVNLKKEFDISKLKFSRNIEKTWKTDLSRMTFESNIIFSEKSFVPRSISLNTTSLILGHSTNVLEMSARLEGLENLLFKLFGPQGYIKKKSASVDDNIDLINLLNDMNGNMDIKVFGQQISFIELVRGSLGSLKKYNIIEQIMSSSQDKSFEMNKSIQLLDKTVVLYTMSGFPLQIKLQGSVTMNIKIKSKLDIAGLISWPINININNHIAPNINAEFNADIVLQTPFSKYGMRMNLKSGTNTEFKALIHATKNEEFSIKFDSPKSNQNIISIEGNTYVIYRNEKRLQLADKMKQSELCAPSYLKRILGIKICGITKYIDRIHRDNALLFGPFSANVYIDKEDTQTSYILRGSSKSVLFTSSTGEIMKNRFMKFEFDTPNSSFFYRKFSGELILDYKEKQFKFEFATPWNQVSMNTLFKFNEAEKKLEFNFQVDKVNIVHLLAEHLRFSSEKGNTVKGGLTVSVMKFNPFITTWNIESTNDQWVLNFLSKGLIKEDTKMKLKILKIQSTRQLSLFNKYDVSGYYNTYFGNGKLSGIASENYYGHRWDVKLIHKSKDQTQKDFMLIFRHKTEDKSSRNLSKYFLTTTLGYGEKAENFIKFITENELSHKHIRTSLKASYGKNENANSKRIEEEVELKLYGGFTWKEDNKHYAEGSLSFKYPSKNLNYEGRYNSEIGNRIFKMALALDKDQQSKVNLKINYLQPKLYLKNTDCEITFSIPNYNVDMKWNLMEVDVNKYKYSLESKFNNYDMRIDGVQTQISKLDHDSSITIKMPNIEGLAKKVSVNLRINLVDLTNARIKGKIEIPDTNYQQSLDVQFSYIPSNLLQIPTSEVTSVFKYDITIVNRDKSMKSKFIFICNPEEFRTYFNWNRNGEIDSNNQIEFDVHASRKNPNYKQFINLARILISYPGNSYTLGFKSEFKYTEMLAQIDITWNKDRKISINTMYELDNSWTQKGFTSSLTIKTPFIGYEQIHFGINAVGQLRYRKIDFECKWGNNKKILFDIVIQPKSSNDFTVSWKLVTPFQGMNLIAFNAKHMYTANSINTQGSLEIGPLRKYQIKFEAINNSEGKNRDYLANILIESGIFPSFKMSFLHKDNRVHYKSQIDAVWMKTESLNIKSDISYSLENYDLITKGNVELFSTIKSVKQMKTIWTIENRDGQFSNDIQLLHNFKSLFQSTLKGFYDYEQETLKVEFNGVATVMNSRSMKIANSLKFQNQNDFTNQFSISQDTSTIYSHNVAKLKDITTIKVLIPNTEFKTIEIIYGEQKMEKSTIYKSSIKVGEKYLMKLETNIMMKNDKTGKIDIKLSEKLYSDYITMREIEHTCELFYHEGYVKYQSLLTSKSATLGEMYLEISDSKEKQKLKFVMKSKLKMLEQIDWNLVNIRKDKGKRIINKLEFNINNILKFNSKVSWPDLSLLTLETSVNYQNVNKYLKLKHNQGAINNEILFDTNVLGKRIRFISSAQFRGGFSIQTKLNCDFPFLRSLEFFARMSKDLEMSLIYQLPKDLKTNEKIKIAFSNKNSLYKISVATTSYFQSEMKINIKSLKEMLFDIETIRNNQKEKVKLQLKFNFEKDGPNSFKYSNQMKLAYGNYNIEIKNKVEKVNWKYLMFGSEIKTNYKNFGNHKIGMEYNLKPNKFLVDFKAFCNEKFIKLSTNLENKSELKSLLNFQTSFDVLKEITFELKHKQNDLYTQVAHKCMAIVKSYDSIFKLENNIEWSGVNYVKIELSITGQISKNTYLIQPKSLKFVHQYYKNVLKENLQFFFSKESNLKVQIQIPLTINSKSLFELESSFRKWKQFSIDININFLENNQKLIVLKINRNNEKVIELESKYKNQNKLFVFTTDFEMYNNYKNSFEIQLSETNFGTKIYKGKLSDSFLKEAIVIIVKTDLPKKEISFSLTGAAKQPISIHGQIIKDQYSFKLKCGANSFDYEMVLNEIEGLTRLKSSLSSVINMKLELSRSSLLLKLTGNFEKHSLTIKCNHNGKFNLDFDILEKSANINFERIFTSKNVNFLIYGTSNIKGMKGFKTELYLTFTDLDCLFKVAASLENRNILTLNCKNIYQKSLTIQYSSFYELIQSGSFVLNYKDIANTFKVTFNAESIEKKTIKAEFSFDKNSFKGKLESPFEWFRNVVLDGELKSESNEINGNFLFNHNKLKTPINGKLIIQKTSNLFQMKLTTPFADPYNEFSMKIDTNNNAKTIEIKDKQNKLFYYTLIKSIDNQVQMEFSLMIPKLITPLIKFTLLTNFDMGNPTNSIKISLKSNLFQDINMRVLFNIDDPQYTLRFERPNYSCIFEMKISKFQTTGKLVKIMTQYDTTKHFLEFEYEIKSISNVYIRTDLKLNSFYSSDTKVGFNYKHHINLPNSFNIDILSKLNDRTVFFKSVSWSQQSDDNSFQFLSNLILSPDDKEYVSKLEFSNKRGEVYDLTISAAEILSEDINVRFVKKPENFQLTIKSPFELIRSVKLSMVVELKTKVNWAQTITFTSNILGKYEVVNEYLFSTNGEVQFSSLLHTPTTMRKLYVQVNIKNLINDQYINGQLELDTKIYQLQLARENQRIQVKLVTPFDYLKTFEFVMHQKLETYEIQTTYNRHNMKIIISQTKETISVTIESNSTYFKSISMEMEKSKINEMEKSINIKINKDEKYFKIKYQFNAMKNAFKYQLNNDLLTYLPKSSSGVVQYSLNPLDIVFEMKSNDNLLLKILINNDQYLLNSKVQLPIYNISISETKFSITKTKVEFAHLTTDTFSLVITKTSSNQIDAAMIINNDQYSSTMLFENVNGKLLFKFSTYKNAMDQIFQIFTEIYKENPFIDFDINYLSKSIIKFKFNFTNLESMTKILTLETRFLSFNGVSDLLLENKADLTNFKLSWNYLYKDEQLLVGSIIYVIKTSKPINFLISLNLHKMAFQAQLMQSDNGQYQLKLSSPFKGCDIDLKMVYTVEKNVYKLWWSVDNSLTGEYITKAMIKISKDPEVKFIFSSISPIINYYLKVITSKPNEITLNTELQLFSFEKLTFSGKLSTKDLIELLITLNTPFSIAKDVQIKKTIKYISIFEHSYETQVVYDGMMKIKYIGKHEIYLTKKIFKFQNSLHHEEVQLMSVNIDHTGNHNSLDHTFVWFIREQKYGFKLNGGFRPLFEGQSEIYTPFHSAGKLVLLGKQMQNGILIEAGKGDGQITSFEYMKEKNVQIMKITPPGYYLRPMAMKLKMKRFKRSVGGEMESEFTYGTDKLFELSTKVKMDKDKYSALLNVAAPQLTGKSAELSMSHSTKDKTINFDHQLKIKDTIHKVYRLFGNVLQENLQNFKMAFNTEHPDLGLIHFSFGHSLTNSDCDHHFVLKSNNKVIVNHIGNVKYNIDKRSYRGEMKTQINSNHYRMSSTHNGDWKEFLQALLVEMNGIPYLRYKNEMKLREKANIEIEIPTMDSSIIIMNFNKIERRYIMTYKSKFTKQKIEITNKNGYIETSYRIDDEPVASLSIGYASQPLFVRGHYLKHSGNVEMTLDNDMLTLKMESSCKQIQKALLKLTSSKIICEVDYLKKPYRFTAEYNYQPNNVFFIMESSIKQFSKLSFQITPEQWKLMFNDFYQTLKYVIKENRVQIIGKNNVLTTLKSFVFDIEYEPLRKAIIKIELNSFISLSKIEYSTDKFIVESENNYLDTKFIQFSMAKKVDKNLQYWTIVLLRNKIQMFKIQVEKKELLYSFGLETTFGHRIVMSYNELLKELIISIKNMDNYMNIIHRMKEIKVFDAKTISSETTIDSSFVKLQKLKHDFSLTISEKVYSMKMSFQLNSKHFLVNGDISKSRFYLSTNYQNIEYIVTINKMSENQIEMKVVYPGHTSIVTLKKNSEQYFVEFQCNEIKVFKVIVKQKREIETSFDHESIVEVYGREVWNINLKSDFKTYKIIMKKPIIFDLAIINDRSQKDTTSLSFLIKHNLYRNPTEIGAGIRFLSTSQTTFCEIKLENNFHIITWKKSRDNTNGKQISIDLFNKQTNNLWQLKLKSTHAKNFELYWKSPTTVKEIKYNEIIENNIRKSLDIDIFGNFVFNMKSNKNQLNLWTGSLSIFSVKIATVEVGKEYVKAIINDGAPENERLLWKWSVSTKGEWKKDYISTTQLIVIQKSFNINFDMTRIIKMEKTLYSTLTTIKHQTSNGSMKSLNLGAILDFGKSNEISFELINPIFPIKTIIRRIQKDSTNLRYEMKSYLENNGKINGYIDIRTGSNPGVTARIYYNPKDNSEFMQIHSKYIDDRQMETRVYMEKDQIQKTYFQLLFRLLNEHHIEMTFHTKMKMVSRVSDQVSKFQKELKVKTLAYLYNELKWLSNEIENRQKQMSKILPNENVIKEKLLQFVTQNKKEVDLFSNEIDMIFRRNEFYIASINEICRRATYLSYQLCELVGSVFTYFDVIQYCLIKAVKEITYSILDLHLSLCRLIYSSTRNIVLKVEILIAKIINLNFPKWEKYWIEVMENFKSSFDQIIVQVSYIKMEVKRSVTLFVLGHTYRSIVRSVEFIKSTIGKLMSGSLDFLIYENEIKSMYKMFMYCLESLSRKIEKIIEPIVSRMDTKYNFIMGEGYFQKMAKVVSSMLEMIIEQMKDENNQKMVRHYIVSSITQSLDDMQLKVQDFTMKVIWPYYIVLDSSRDQRIYSDEEFKIILRLTSPIPFNDFKSLPDFAYVSRKINKIRSKIQTVKMVLNNRLSSGKKLLELRNWFQLYMPSTSMPSILPDFESYATISKSSVVTFDKSSFEIDESKACKVLLSKDIKNHQWEIILNQQKNINARSYIINIGSNSFEISQNDYNVKLNGKPIDIPIKISSTSLVGLGRVMKLKNEDLGLTITVDPINEMLTVGISGWYHGNVRGLFGNSDNEPFNDFMLDNGNMVSSNVFMKAFDYNSPSCSIVEPVKETEIKPIKSCPYIRKLVCKFLYKCPLSPLAPCFKTVDPSNFLKSCICSKEEMLTKLDPSVCNSAKQYQAQCSQKGVKIPLPLPCQKCDVNNKNDKPLLVNEYRNIKVKDKVSDVVFIVDEGHCLNFVRNNLINIISSMEKDMQTKGISSVKFGLVTFVKDQVANFHTIGQKMFGSSEDMIRSVKRLETSNNNKLKDIVGAISLAYNYPFREHASRHIVMLSCDGAIKLPVTLQTISEKLQKKAINFSLLTNFSFQLKDITKKSIIFGVDSKNIFTPLARNGEQQNLTSRPENDILYKLAIKMKGVVFDYKFLNFKTEMTEKIFTNSFVNQICQRATPARTTKCTCVADNEYNCVPLDFHTIFPVKKMI